MGCGHYMSEVRPTKLPWRQRGARSEVIPFLSAGLSYALATSAPSSVLLRFLHRRCLRCHRFITTAGTVRDTVRVDNLSYGL